MEKYISDGGGISQYKLLKIAATSKNSQSLEVLMRFRGKPSDDPIDQSQLFELFAAAWNVKALEVLLRQDEDADTRNRSTKSAMLKALQTNSGDLFSLLLSSGTKIDDRFQNGSTYLITHSIIVVSTLPGS